MNRADLAWALNAVIPHCGKTEQTAIVGLTFVNGVTYVYATDTYTLGIARITESADVNLWLPAKEATALLRFIRPGNKAEQAEELAFGIRPGEFHVGYDSAMVETDDGMTNAIVFDSVDEGPPFAYFTDFIGRLLVQPSEFDQCIYQPAVMAKFAKAQRAETDRLYIMPKHVSDRNGLAVVRVGDDFLGAIAGLTYDETQNATAAFFPEGIAA